MLCFKVQPVLCTFTLYIGVTQISFIFFSTQLASASQLECTNFEPFPSTTALFGGKTMVIGLLHLLLFQPGAFAAELPPALQGNRYPLLI